MKFNCAAKELCGMQGVPFQEGRHVCMNCMSPMHGGLCGYEFPDGVTVGIDMTLLQANLSAHGQDIAAKKSNDSIICFICFNGAIFSHSSKTPSTACDPLDGLKGKFVVLKVPNISQLL